MPPRHARVTGCGRAARWCDEPAGELAQHARNDIAKAKQRLQRAGAPLALDLVRDSALVLSNLDGTHRHPERFSRRFVGQVLQARKTLGEDQLPVIRLHDLRHTHATLLLADGVPVKVVSERLGHASITLTLDTYSHVLPTMQQQAANAMAQFLDRPAEAAGA